MSEWISMKERIPPFEKRVLVWRSDKKTSSTGKRSHFGERRKWWWMLSTGSLTSEEGSVVTHWQPLPDPPKEEA